MDALAKCIKCLREIKLEIEIYYNVSTPILKHEGLNVWKQKWVECELLGVLKHVKMFGKVKSNLYIANRFAMDCCKIRSIHDLMERMNNTSL